MPDKPDKLPDIEKIVNEKAPFGDWFLNVKEAWEKTKEVKEKGMKGLFKKIWIFIESYFSEKKAVEDEEDKVTEETEAVVEKSYDEKLKVAMEAVEVKEDAEKNENYEFFVAGFVSNLNEMEKSDQGQAIEAFKKVSQANEGQEVDMSVKQAANLARLTMSSLLDIKADPRCDTKEEMQAFLEDVYKYADENTAYSPQKILSVPFLKLFNMTEDDALNILTVFGIEASVGDAASKIPIIGGEFKGDVLESVDTLKMIGKKGGLSNSEKEQIAELLHEKFFGGNADLSKVKDFVGILNNIANGSSSYLTPENLADLLFVFHPDDSPFKYFIDKLGNV